MGFNRHAHLQSVRQCCRANSIHCTDQEQAHDGLGALDKHPASFSTLRPLPTTRSSGRQTSPGAAHVQPSFLTDRPCVGPACTQLTDREAREPSFETRAPHQNEGAGAPGGPGAGAELLHMVRRLLAARVGSWPASWCSLSRAVADRRWRWRWRWSSERAPTLLPSPLPTLPPRSLSVMAPPVARLPCCHYFCT